MLMAFRFLIQSANLYIKLRVAEVLTKLIEKREVQTQIGNIIKMGCTSFIVNEMVKIKLDLICHMTVLSNI